MKLIIEIELGNDAFNDPATEIVRILREKSWKMLHDGVVIGESKICDLNGNHVGNMAVVD